MASASVSVPVAYNSPSVSTHCGDIYCSDTFEDFLINCSSCTQEFNLLSCTLFIKHVKECTQNTNKNSDYITEKIFTPALKRENIEIGSASDNHLDPLLSMKIEIESAPELIEVPSFEDVDCSDESELPSKKIKRRDMLIGLIDEYKKHPLLWDVNLEKTATPSDRTFHFKQIQLAFNLKYKTQFTVSELRRQIAVMRGGYRRALKTDSKREKPPLLWYFDKMSFIMKSTDAIKQEMIDKKSDDFKMEVSVDEDDTSSTTGNLHQLSNYDVILDIIDQFKKNAILWQASGHSKQMLKERSDVLNNIAIFINNKYQTDVDGRDVFKKIGNLRDGYKKARLVNKRFNQPITLWYYHELSDIFEKNQPDEAESDDRNSEDQTVEEMPLGELKIELVTNESHSESQDNKVLDSSQQSDNCDDYNGFEYNTDSDDKDHDDDNSDGDNEFCISKKVVFIIIEEYKKHPCLWNNELHQHSAYTERSAALRSITEAVNAKCNKTFSEDTIKSKFANLRTCYKRVLRSKENYEQKHPNAKQKFPIFLYYFDQISFIGKTYRKATLSTVGSTRTRPHDWSIDKNRELLTCIIEEYRKQPVLWCGKYSRKEFLARRNAHAAISKVVNDKFLTKFTPEQISCQIRRLRCAYRTMLRRKRNGQRHLLWYADLLSFIEEEGDDDDNGICKEESPDDNQKNAGVTKERKRILTIIKLYKAAPILWDTNHKAFNHRSAKSKVLQNMTSSLNAEHNCQLSTKQLRRQILYLRSSYCRALRNETVNSDEDIGKQSAKPFFYDQMSFLEPFVKQNTNAPIIKTSMHASEDLKFLTENRPLMFSFIELYKEQRCLWDLKHKDIRDASVKSEAYENIINMFLQNDVNLTKQQVLSAIDLLHATASGQETSEADEKSETTFERVWFYEHLKFLNEIPRISDKYCSHCNQHFRSIRQYEKHKLEIGENPFVCAICNEEFSSRNKYRYHRLTHSQPLKCEQCDFQAYDKYNMKVHMRRHQGDTPYQCETCDKAFVTSTELKRHALIHTGEKTFVCYICGNKMASNSELYQHMKRHRNQRDHKCSVCGSAFYTPKGLRNHMAGHSDERNHICDVCGATFKRKMTLKQHKALHAEQKKHECKICAKLFAQKAGLYSHMKSH